MLVTVPEPAENRLLTTQEVADRLRCSREKIRALAIQGEIVQLKLTARMHRVSEQSLNDYVARTRG